MKKTGRIMGVDIETYSEADLTKTGVYAYAADPSFEILLIAYQIDDGPVEVLEAGDDCPEFWDALTDPSVIKHAYNANFERTCFKAWTGRDMPPEQWRCCC